MENTFNPKAGDEVFVMAEGKIEKVFVTAKTTHERFTPGNAKPDVPVVEYRVEKINRIVKIDEIFPTKEALVKTL